MIPKQVYKPWLAGLAAATIPIGAFALGFDDGIVQRGAGFAAALAVYIGVLSALRIADEDMAALLPWRKRASPGATQPLS